MAQKYGQEATTQTTKEAKFVLYKNMRVTPRSNESSRPNIVKSPPLAHLEHHGLTEIAKAWATRVMRLKNLDDINIHLQALSTQRNEQRTSHVVAICGDATLCWRIGGQHDYTIAKPWPIGSRFERNSSRPK